VIPAWLHALSSAYLVLGGFCAVILCGDLVRHPQHMWIMNFVWPICALFGTLRILLYYFAYGRQHGHAKNRATPFWITVAIGTLHCGSGCVLGDICAEWLVYAVPAVAVVFGWRSIFAEKMFAVWIVDYVFAYVFGIFFQYLAIAPMRGLSFGQGMLAAIKADTLSLTAWQIGMYGFMALASFAIFRGGFGTMLETDSVEFWFMLQIGMMVGFITSYPANWWLIRRGIKEEM
jgi:Domain of unknown function (DUF4396)